MQHRQNQWTLVFPHQVEYIMMLDTGDEQLWPVSEKNPCSGLLLSNGSQVCFKQCFVTPRLFYSPC